MDRERFIRAKIQMLVDEPFFGQLASYLVPVEVDKKLCPTMGVNQLGELYVNPEFVDSLPFKELKGVLMHEILHLALLHPSRVQDFNHRLFNVAADLKVNDILLNGNKEVCLPKDGIFPNYRHEWALGKIRIEKIDEKTAEQIYHELQKQCPKEKKIKVMLDLKSSTGQNDKNNKKGKGKGGANIPGNSRALTKEEMETAKNAWSDKVNGLKVQGLMPANIDRALNKLRAHKITWNSWLNGRFARIVKERSWSRANKRWLPWYYPGASKVKGLRCVVAVDTSGSISDKEYSEIISELYGIYNDFRGAVEMIVISCDSEIHDVYYLKENEQEKLKNIKLKGGGGTDFNPVFNWIRKELRQEVDCLLYFTDGYGDFPPRALPFDTMWVMTSDVKPPFGKTLSLK